MIYGILSTELFWTALIWLFVLVILGVVIVGMWHEHYHFRILFKHPGQNNNHLLAILYRRHLQLWMLVVLLVVVLAANDLRRAFLQLPEETLTATPAIIPTPTPAASAGISTLGPAPLLFPSPLPFSDITEFNEKDSKEQAYIDLLKRRYEEWLVIYYHLQKCGKTDAGDFDIIRSALTKELTSAHAEESVQGNILLAATGSYNEMYRDIPCDKEYLNASKASYDVNMQQLRKLLAAPPNAKMP